MNTWLTLLATLTLLLPLYGQEKTTKPNILLIVADDLGYGDLSFTGSKQIATPAIDSLGKEGLFCEQGYVTAANCAPSRMGFLSGRQPGRFGVKSNLNYLWPSTKPENMGFPLSERTLADALKSVGYRTGIIGKWHLGERPEYHPTERGFDEFWGFLGGSRSYKERKKVGAGESIETTLQGASTKLTHLTEDITRQAQAFIKRHQDKPFFLYVAYNAPHSPYEPAAEDEQELNFIQDPQRRKYAALVRGLDKGVARLLHTLKEENLENDTLVIFFSDNGGARHSGACNAPFVGNKRTHYEGGIHVPIFLRYPAKIPAGKRLQEPFSTLDLFPTLCAWTGATPSKNLEGINQDQALRTAKGTPRPSPLFWQMQTVVSLLHQGYKYHMVADRLPLLFDLKNDPQEQHNLLTQEPEKAASLAKLIGQWLSSTPPALFPDSNAWDKVLFEEYDATELPQQPAKD